MKHDYSAEYKNVRLRPLEKRDIEKLRKWRNDKESTRYLRRIDYISSEAQEKWYESYLASKDQIVFAIEETENLKRIIGSVSLYDIKEDVAEFGRILIGDKDARGKGLGKISTALILQFGFNTLGLKKIIATVNVENVPACKTYFGLGFKITGKHSLYDGFEYDIEINKEDLYKNFQF